MILFQSKANTIKSDGRSHYIYIEICICIYCVYSMYVYQKIAPGWKRVKERQFWSETSFFGDISKKNSAGFVHWGVQAHDRVLFHWTWLLQRLHSQQSDPGRLHPTRLGVSMALDGTQNWSAKIPVSHIMGYTGTVVIFSIGKISGMHRSWTQKTCPFFLVW